METRTRQGAISADEIRLDEGELKRRLGGDFGSTLEKYDGTAKQLLKTVKIRYSAADCALSLEEGVSFIGEAKIRSQALSKCLSGCTECTVIALTLGIDTDRAVRRAAAESQTLGFVADALASVIADSACFEIANMLFGSEKHSSPFAVGYADSTTDSLPTLLKIAAPHRTLGITFTDARLMKA